MLLPEEISNENIFNDIYLIKVLVEKENKNFDFDKKIFDYLTEKFMSFSEFVKNENYKKESMYLFFYPSNDLMKDPKEAFCLEGSSFANFNEQAYSIQGINYNVSIKNYLLGKTVDYLEPCSFQIPTDKQNMNSNISSRKKFESVKFLSYRIDENYQSIIKSNSSQQNLLPNLNNTNTANSSSNLPNNKSGGSFSNNVKANQDKNTQNQNNLGNKNYFSSIFNFKK